MIRIENTKAVGWEAAIRSFTGKGYRKTQNGRYETFCSDRRETISLGTYDTVQEAEGAVFSYRAERLINCLNEYGLDIKDGVLFEDNYLVFSNGMIFNLYGHRMVGGINRDGYVHGIINGRNISFHRVIASVFCEHKAGNDVVNHIDGNKTNNNANNLEWVTKSENTVHSFRVGLQTNVAKVPVYTCNEKKYIRDHCFDYYKDVAAHLGRNPETVRKYMERYRKEKTND